MPTIAFTLLWNVGLTTVLAIFVGLLTRSKILRHQPRLAHVLWLLVLAKFITPPLIPLPLLPGLTSGQADERLEVAGGVESLHVQDGPTGIQADLAASLPDVASRATLLSIAIVVSGCGTLILIAASLLQLFRVSRILRSASGNDERLNRLAQTAAYRLRIRAKPVVFAVDAAMSPLLWVRWSGPVVVLPIELIKSMNDERITCILCHELAHYARLDHWSNAFTFSVVALFWWHPVAWWARYELRAVQEVCCDGLALGMGAVTCRCYAETLFEALEFIQNSRPLQPTLVNGFGSSSSLKRRFEMIGSVKLTRQFSWWGTSLAIAAIVAMFCVPVRGQPAPLPTVEVPPYDYMTPITVTGRVLNDKGKPIPGATVYLASVGDAPMRIAEAKSDDDGKYAFRDALLPILNARPGQDRDLGAFEVFGVAPMFGFGWKPQKWLYPMPAPVGVLDAPGAPDPKAEPHSYEAGNAITLDLTLRPAARLAGRIVDEQGRAIKQAEVRIVHCEPIAKGTDGRLSSLAANKTVPAEMNVCRSDQDGRFEFSALPPDCRFQMLIQPKELFHRWVWAATTDKPQPDYGKSKVHTGPVQLTFASPVEVPFRVNLGDSRKPAAKALVTIESPSAYVAEETDADGRVTLRVPPGEYNLSMMPARGTPYLETLDKLVVPQTAPVEPLVGQLHPAGIIELSLRNETTGAGIAGAEFWLDRGDGTRESYFYRWWEKPVADFVRPRTDKDGKLRVLIEPGKHLIGVRLPAQLSDHIVVEGDGLKTECQPGKVVEVKFTLRPR